MLPTRIALAAVTTALVLAGCAGEQTTGDGEHLGGHATTGADDPDHAMGGMDEAMPSASPPPASADWNLADATYLTEMVAHHSQALDLAELAATRASDPRVRAVAETIDVGQGREIVVMATWLVDHGQPEPTPDSVARMSTMGMPGMLTQGQLAALAETRGATFDRTFLEDMIQHHQGAVEMAEDVLGSGRDVRVSEMAGDVVTGQGAEIVRMRRLLQVLA